MANITLTNLPTVTSLAGTEPLLGVQSSSSVQITTGQIATYTLGLVGIGLPVTVPNGGTGQTSFVSNGILIGNGTGPLQVVPPPSGNNYVLVGSAGTTPSWQATIPVTAGVDSVAFGTTGLTPTAATAGVVSVAFGTVPTAAGIYSPATNQIALSTNSTRQLLIDSTGAATFTTSATSPLFLATASRTATATTGAFSYGTNGFSDVNVLASFQSSVNNYNQVTIQNTSAGTSASAEFIAYNDGGTASTNYAAVGINSSGYTGTGSLNAAGYGFFATGSTDLVLGTIGSNAIHFVTNSSATDAMSISAAGVVSIPSASITSLTTPLVIGGTTASSTLTLESTSGAGTSDLILFKTGSQQERMRIDTSGNVGIGTSSPGVPLDVIGNIKNSSTTGTPVITVQSNQAAGFNPARLQLYRTGAGNTATPDNSIIGEIRFDGLSTGAAYDNMATIQVTSGVNATGGAPSNMLFFTASSGAANTERMRIDSSGNLTFTGTAQRFLADFDNATVNSRFAFQTKTTNAATGIYALPNGTSTAASWQATNAADPTNASKILIATNGSTDVQLVSGINGTGTYLPLSFYNNGAQKMQLGTNGALAIGANASTTVGLLNSWAITGATTAFAQSNNGVVQSGVTSAAYSYYSNVSLAASVTTSSLYHNYVNPAAGGATSTITNHVGYFAESTIGTAGAATITNAYGFYGNIASGTNKWNLYMAGTASNYMAGALGVGTVSVGAAGTITASSTISDSIGNVRTIVQNSQTSAYVLVATDNGKYISITTGGVTVPASIFTAGQNIVIFNNSGSSQTITQGASVTMNLAGSATTGNRTLAQYGVATVLCTGTNTFVITGQGLT